MNTISLDKPFAHGRTADIYSWDETHILKLFHNSFGLDHIEYEMKTARAVHASGIKTPNVPKLIQVNGRNGLIYERANGVPMLTLLQRKPWMVFTYSRLLARLHAEMHEHILNADIYRQHDKLRDRIHRVDSLSASLKDSLLHLLASLPAGDRVCHGDFHPANILISDSEATVIDWVDVTRGNPLADVARTTVIFLGSANSSQSANVLMKLYTKLSHTIYLREYFRLRPHGLDEYHRWIPIMAAVRLLEGMPELEKWLMTQAEKATH